MMGRSKYLGAFLFSADLSEACAWEGPGEDSCCHLSSTMQPQGQLATTPALLQNRCRVTVHP